MKRLLLSFALMMIFVLPNARADNSDFTVYVEWPLPIKEMTVFTVDEEAFNASATGQIYGLMIPFGNVASRRPALDLAYSRISLRDFHFNGATTRSREFFSVHDPEDAHFQIVEAGIRSYPNPLGISLLYAWGDWEDQNRRTGLTKENNIDSLGLKFGVNFNFERLMLLANIRWIFDPSITLFSSGLGWSF